jgi:hypothetical protein
MKLSPLPTIVKVKRVWKSTSTPHMYIHDADTDNFIVSLSQSTLIKVLFITYGSIEYIRPSGFVPVYFQLLILLNWLRISDRNSYTALGFQNNSTTDVSTETEHFENTYFSLWFFTARVKEVHVLTSSQWRTAISSTDPLSTN